MLNMNCLPLCLAVLVAVASGVAALKCYTCSLCNDPFDTKGAGTAENCKACLKVKAGESVIRSCFPTAVANKCEEKNGAETCYCNSDLCNSAHRGGLSYISLIFYTLTAIIFWKI